MIRAVGLANVRIFEGSDWKCDLKPLTVFCGTNSAGKSTLLKSLLLLRQSQEHKIAGRLSLGGPRVDFGDYHSFVSHEDVTKTVGLSVTVDYTLSPATMEFFRRGEKGRKRAGLTVEAVATVGELKTDFEFALHTPSGDSGLIKGGAGLTPDTTGYSGVLERAHYSIRAAGKELLHWRVTRQKEPNDSGEYEIEIPEAFFRRVGGFRIMSVTKQMGRVHEKTILSGLLPQFIVAKPKPSQRPKSSQVEASSDRFTTYPTPPTIQNAQLAFNDCLEKIHYVGPLRSPAKRYYIASLGTDPDMDPTGEFLPYVLRDRALQRVTNVLPGSNGDPVIQTLEEALNVWVGYLRTGDKGSKTPSELGLDTTKNVLIQINVKSLAGAESHALADSGFGYSQVLPILVRGLLIDAGGTFIVEQPELHLNPSLQVRLAEFFISMVRAGKQVLIETHSEHIVNAVRVLTAEDETHKLTEQSRIYFIEAAGSVPVLHELSVQADGTIPDWPRHFFGEAIELTGWLLRAQKRFRETSTLVR